MPSSFLSKMKPKFPKLFGFQIPRHLSLKHILLFTAIYLLASICCFWQIISVCRLFYEYPTIVSVEADNMVCPKELPAISFCSLLEPIINFVIQKANKPIEEYFKKFNLSDQIFKFELLTPDYETINGSTVGEDIRNSLVQTINAVYVCYTFNSLIKSRVKLPIKLGRKQILEIKLDLSLIGNSSFLFLHDWYSVTNGWDWNTIQIKPNTDTTLSFSKKRFNLLKSPYFTDCVDYKKTTAFVSRYHCLTVCQIRVSQEKCHFIAEDVNVQINESGNFPQNKEDRDCMKEHDFQQHCQNECSHPDCTDDHYKAIHFYTSASMYNSSEAYVRLKIPTEPQTIYNYKPKVEMIEYLCYCASLIGLWFGFSIVSIYYPIKCLIDWFDSRKSERKLFHSKMGKAKSVLLSQRLLYHISSKQPPKYPYMFRLKSI